MKGSGTFVRKAAIRSIPIILAILLVYSPVWADTEKLTVMTRNVYIGTDILSVADAGSLPEFVFLVNLALQQVAATNFPERANELAKEIAKTKPHLVGLQEVYNFTINGENQPAMLPFVDYLVVLLDALKKKGLHYKPVATVTNFDIALPIPYPFPTPTGTVVLGVTDRDVILARQDVSAEVVDLATSGVCPEDRVSDDGCNYEVIARTVVPGEDPIPDIVIEIERGYVAVDATYRSLKTRFYNTHLEVRFPADDPTAPLIQAAQAAELIQAIDFLEKAIPHEGPVIVVGDFNSDPRDPQILPLDPPYTQMVDAGYTDAWWVWPRRWKGYTCCQDADLLNRKSVLYERVDLIFLRDFPFEGLLAFRVGQTPFSKTPSGLWPSDHAGVVAKIWYDVDDDDEDDDDDDDDDDDNADD